MGDVRPKSTVIRLATWQFKIVHRSWPLLGKLGGQAPICHLANLLNLDMCVLKNCVFIKYRW